jgi:hypothetical protein
MIYLSGSTFKNTPNNIGFMATPRSGISLAADGRFWAGDNGSFTSNFDEVKFFSFFEKMVVYQKTCLFLTCPDKLCDPITTMSLYDIYSSRIKAMGFKLAFVCQDGQENYEIPACDAIFIGGSTHWKLSKGADACINIAKNRNLWVHVGRVNTRKRIHHFSFRNVDSLDGTFIAFGPYTNIPKLQRWLREVNLQSTLEF